MTFWITPTLNVAITTYKVPKRFFNLILVSEDMQGDKVIQFVCILFRKALKIEINHSLNIKLFDKRLIWEKV